jgi:hypothetical protein
MKPKKPEEIFQKSILDLCALRHLKVAHFRPALTKTGRWITAVSADGKGWPDLSICGPGGLIFRELKSATGVLKPEQRDWLAWLTEAGQDAGVWKPKDMQSGLIPDTLKRLSKSAVTR